MQESCLVPSAACSENRTQLKRCLEIHIKSQISFCKIMKKKWYHVKELPKRFDLNGHTIGFHPQTQKLELHYMSP